MAPPPCRNRTCTTPDHTGLPGPEEAGVHESLRWPPHLEHAEIVRRLVAIRDTGPLDSGAFFAGVEAMPAAQIGAAVIAALAWLQGHRGQESLTHQLQILALNLKNLE